MKITKIFLTSLVHCLFEEMFDDFHGLRFFYEKKYYFPLAIILYHSQIHFYIILIVFLSSFQSSLN